MSDDAMPSFLVTKPPWCTLSHRGWKEGGRRRRVHKEGKTLLGPIEFDTPDPLAK